MAKDRPLPTAAMREKWGRLPDLHYRGDEEWHSSCPNCGMAGHDSSTGLSDRFIISPPWRRDPNRFGVNTRGEGACGYCRRCGHTEFSDEGIDSSPSPEAIAAAKKSREEYIERERARKKKVREWLKETDFWLKFHDEMTGEQRKEWHRQGIKDWAIEMHKLGYRTGKNGSDGALSIPYLAGGWEPNNIITLQYRLLCPEDPKNKYRFMKGTTHELFRPWPEDELKGVVLVLEGAKKAIVTYGEAHDIKYRGKRVVMCAAPSKEVPERLIKQLDNAELIIWLLDPDAYVSERTNGKRTQPAIDRNIAIAGKERSLIVKPADKIDDMIIKYGLGRNTIEAMVNQAGPWFGYR